MDKHEQMVYNPDSYRYLRTGLSKLGAILGDENHPDFSRAVELVDKMNELLQRFEEQDA